MKLISKSLFVLAGLLTTIDAFASGAHVLHIKNQADFDLLPQTINTIIGKESEVKVVLAPGTYYFKEKHLVIENVDNRQVTLEFEGNGAKIVSAGRNFWNGSEYKLDFNCRNGMIADGEDVHFWSDVRTAEEPIEIVDEASKLCCFRTENVRDMSEEECSKAYVLLPIWYYSMTYRIKKIEDNCVYFIANDLTFNEGRKQYNVNYDTWYDGSNPRIKMCNTYNNENFAIINGKVRTSLKQVHECENNTFLSIVGCKMKSVSITGIEFCGNSDHYRGLIEVKNSKFDAMTVSGCKFNALQSTVMTIDNTDNVTFENNDVRNTYASGVKADVRAANVRVTDNYFEENGLRMSNFNCVYCQGQDYYIARNTFRNFGYNAIASGVVWNEEKAGISRGVIELNEMSYDEKYMSNLPNYTLKDAGAIYTFTQHDDVTIRYNYVHSYAGTQHYRGIFLDDGTSNAHVYGNVVVDVPVYYNIDLRRDDSWETLANSKTRQFSENDVIEQNFVDGVCLFQGKAGNYTNIKGQNFLLTKSGEDQPQFLVKNITERNGKDTGLDYLGLRDGKVWLSRQSYARIARLPWFAKVEKWFVRN